MKRERGWRAVLFHRFASLPFNVPPAARRWVGALVWSFWIVYFLFILLILSLRYAILPRIENHRPAIERMIAENIGRKVSIGRIDASWAGLYPHLTLAEVRVADTEGRPALSFSRIDLEPSWQSLTGAGIRLRLLRIDAPTLHMRRAKDGRFFVAGIPLAQESGGSRGKGASWMLDQRRIRVDGATLIWKDEMRGAPALVLADAHLVLENGDDGQRHRFGLTARPVGGFASRLDVRGDFAGGDLDRLGEWRGRLFAQVDYADLAVWKRWVDYPIALPRGRGAARVWLDFAGGGVRDLTADVVLRATDLKFGEKLPALQLDSLSGRWQASFRDEGLTVKGDGIALRLYAEEKGNGGAPIRLDPADFGFEWRTESGANAGRLEIGRLDLEVLTRLAACLPLEARARQRLADFMPRGRVDALAARWSGDAEKVSAYSLKAGVRNLGVRAQGHFPGFSGITGTLEANEAGGQAVLRSGASSIDLPAVFPESPIRLDSLNAQASWRIDGDGLAVDLAHAEFTNPDTAGSAKGTYRTADDGPGIIDLGAVLKRTDARAVWRYLPYVVSQTARHWVRDSLLAGQADEARLILKGNLKDFPFPDEQLGQFRVTIKARDVVLDYAGGWPRIDGIVGDLRFAGRGMTVEAQQGNILGARLANTRVIVPDLDAPLPILEVKGEASGPTAEFLKFIDRSPVAGAIDRFTEDMRAVGNGRLDIELSIPLDEKKLHETRVAGVYHLTNNAVTVDAALPPLVRVNGSLRFSDGDLSVPEIRASLFGGPLKIRGGLQKGGGVLIVAEGIADVDALRRQSEHPLLARLSGKTPYRSEIRIIGRNADLSVESKLDGLASTLPEPFAKAADEMLPLYFERRLLSVDDAARVGAGKEVRDRIGVSLGTILKARVIRRKTAGDFMPERGAVAIGRPLRIPETGLALDVSAKRLDLDLWRELLDEQGAATSSTTSPWRPDTVNLQADELSVRGLSWNDVDLSADLTQAPWKIRIDSRQMLGDVTWSGVDGGRLAARLDRLAIERLPPHSEEPASRLPALDVVVDHFTVRKLDFGRLHVLASNGGAGWNLERIEASNPHGTLTGQGFWRHEGGAGRTQLSFKLESGDVGRLLARLDYPGTVRAGSARLDGTLAWNGAPTEIDYASMRGELNLDAAKGQFLKLDPGAAGKLLSLISLQNLPRRISLDFKDVFSEGLVFDTLAGKITVENGIMRTRRLRIDGPSARVSMRGEVDLAHETQRLEVTVRPEIGSTAAVGMAMVHPAAGVATWLANRMLKNPLGTMFAYDYRITGSWDDPKIEKLGASAESGGDP
jgi:uncharacterized protein (TIGR02099 family)